MDLNGIPAPRICHRACALGYSTAICPGVNLVSIFWLQPYGSRLHASDLHRGNRDEICISGQRDGRLPILRSRISGLPRERARMRRRAPARGDSSQGPPAARQPARRRRGGAADVGAHAQRVIERVGGRRGCRHVWRKSRLTGFSPDPGGFAPADLARHGTLPGLDSRRGRRGDTSGRATRRGVVGGPQGRVMRGER